MDYSQLISRRHWNLPDKGEREAVREQTFIDDIVLKSHIEKELLASLDGVSTVFDGGGGAGRFSILLAQRGCRVTHLDISRPMLDKAAELAEAAGVRGRIEFVQGALEDLSAYRDGEFDLVMSFDAPISYTYPNQERVIAELVRICRRRIMLSVSSRLGWLPYCANPVQKLQFVLDDDCADPWVRGMIAGAPAALDGFRFDGAECARLWRTGLMGGDAEREAYDRGEAPWPITYGFMPDELEGILRRCGVREIELAGPGAYARTLPREILRSIINDPEQRAEFLEFCHCYDRNPYVCGMGKDNLFAKGTVV